MHYTRLFLLAAVDYHSHATLDTNNSPWAHKVIGSRPLVLVVIVPTESELVYIVVVRLPSAST
jgi:hypothetical protein